MYRLVSSALKDIRRAHDFYSISEVHKHLCQMFHKNYYYTLPLLFINFSQLILNGHLHFKLSIIVLETLVVINKNICSNGTIPQIGIIWNGNLSRKMFIAVYCNLLWVFSLFHFPSESVRAPFFKRLQDSADSIQKWRIGLDLTIFFFRQC